MLLIALMAAGVAVWTVELGVGLRRERLGGTAGLQAGATSAAGSSASAAIVPSSAAGSSSGGSSPPRSVPAISSSLRFSAGMKPDFIPK